MPIETPAMENLTTLLGKYGEEGDKLLFRVLNSGDFLSGVDRTALTSDETIKIASRISEKGLRYDLTVPFARYVVQHRNDITFPFKRYQLQPVWRADRPQKGRYREFFQCDADIVGSDSLLNEAELLVMADRIFEQLNIPIVIKLNNRKILSGIAEIIGHPDKIIDITVAIDKLDKIGLEKVNQELAERGLSQEQINSISKYLAVNGSNEENDYSNDCVIFLDCKSGSQYCCCLCRDRRCENTGNHSSTVYRGRNRGFNRCKDGHRFVQ